MQILDTGYVLEIILSFDIHSQRQRKTSERFKRNSVQQRGPL